MAIISVPPGIRSIDWRLPRMNRFTVTSPWAGSQKVGDLGSLAAGFSCTVSVAPGSPERARQWRGFFAALKGPVNTFLLAPDADEQLARPAETLLVAGAGQTGPSLNVDGAPLNLPLLARAGDIITIGGRGHVLRADAASNGSGAATLALEPPLATAPADNAVVLLRRPLIEMRLAPGEAGWSEGLARVTEPFQFQAVEVVA